MVRPRKDRLVAFEPDVSYFKPRGIPMIDLAEVCLTVDEREAIRLADQLGLSQEEAGRRMGVSRATFGRIIQRARRSVADALISGKAIRIDGGNYRIVMEGRRFQCGACGHRWDEAPGTGRPSACPLCGSENFFRTAPRDPDGASVDGLRPDDQRRS
jgi:predicted DNA-binding protein (UPF0251 family)/DNA-directed RNA polymerase subunit RPC12/RpoP